MPSIRRYTADAIENKKKNQYPPQPLGGDVFQCDHSASYHTNVAGRPSPPNGNKRSHPRVALQREGGGVQSPSPITQAPLRRRHQLMHCVNGAEGEKQWTPLLILKKSEGRERGRGGVIRLQPSSSSSSTSSTSSRRGVAVARVADFAFPLFFFFFYFFFFFFNGPDLHLLLAADSSHRKFGYSNRVRSTSATLGVLRDPRLADVRTPDADAFDRLRRDEAGALDFMRLATAGDTFLRLAAAGDAFLLVDVAGDAFRFDAIRVDLRPAATEVRLRVERPGEDATGLGDEARLALRLPFAAAQSHSSRSADVLAASATTWYLSCLARAYAEANPSHETPQLGASARQIGKPSQPGWRKHASPHRALSSSLCLPRDGAASFQPRVWERLWPGFSLRSGGARPRLTIASMWRCPMGEIL
jgi:hypothetical protein